MEFMIVDIQCIDYAPASIENLFADESFNEVCPENCDKESSVVLFGRCADGKSAAVRVTGWKPWVRFELPTGSQQELQDLLRDIKNVFRATPEYTTKKLKRFYGYVGDPGDPNVAKTFTYVDVKAPSFRMASILQSKKLRGMTDVSQTWASRFANDVDITPMTWARVSQAVASGLGKWSTCDIEMTISVRDIVHIERNDIAPLKVLSFDCEMYSKDGLFPKPEKGDITVMVCSTVWSYGSDKTMSYRQVWTPKTNLMESFRDLIVREDPDVVTGWNVYGFDFQFMWKEYAAARKPFRRGVFTTRFSLTPSTFVERSMNSAAKGDNHYCFWSMEGRVPVDLMQIIKDDKKPEDNTLKHVASIFLDDFNKLDMTPHEMFAAWASQDSTGIEAMATYCERDAAIPVALIQKLMYVPTWVELARVCFTPLYHILNGGQQRRVYNVISRFVMNKYAINQESSGWPAETDDSDYQGATVIEPISGFYKQPVSVLDFESLYPSIMIYFNLCPSVLLLDHDKANTVPHDSHKILHGASFEKEYKFAKHTTGVLPELLRHLLKTRKAVKAQMNTATGFEKFVLNGRQNALKVVCNSVYGFCGVSQEKGLLPCKPVAAVTTLKGRAFIDAAKTYVEATWSGSKVLYGDTDSIMVLWPGNISIAEAYDLGDKAAKEVTDVLRSGTVAGLGLGMLSESRLAVRLANEKVECPYLLIRKKMYAAVKHTPGKMPGTFVSEVEAKGIDAVRRDRTKLVRDLSDNILDALMVKSDETLAFRMLQETLDNINDNKIPMENYVLSKSLKGTYVNGDHMPHVAAWQRMRDRGDSGLPPVGSRMPMVFTLSKTSETLYNVAEHPEYAKKMGLRPWPKYYIESVRSAIERLLEPTGMNVAGLFEAALDRAKFIASGNASLMKRSVSDGSTASVQQGTAKKKKTEPVTSKRLF